MPARAAESRPRKGRRVARECAEIAMRSAGRIGVLRDAFGSEDEKTGEGHAPTRSSYKTVYCPGRPRRSAVRRGGRETASRRKVQSRIECREGQRSARGGKEATRQARIASLINQSSSVGRMVRTGQVAFLTTFSATEPKRMRSMPLRPRVPMTMMSACSLSAMARISSAA